MTVAVVCWILHTCHVDMYHTSNELTIDNIKIIFTDQCIHQNFIYNSYMYVCVYTRVPATRVSCSLLKPASYLLPVLYEKCRMQSIQTKMTRTVIPTPPSTINDIAGIHLHHICYEKCSPCKQK